MNRQIAFLTAAALGLVVVAAAAAQTKPAAPVKPAATAAKPAAAAPVAGSDAALRAAIIKAVPGATIDSIKPSPIPGYREVAIGGKVVYVQHRRQAS